jgi:hypothetical protein
VLHVFGEQNGSHKQKESSSHETRLRFSVSPKREYKSRAHPEIMDAPHANNKGKSDDSIYAKDDVIMTSCKKWKKKMALLL